MSNQDEIETYELLLRNNQRRREEVEERHGKLLRALAKIIDLTEGYDEYGVPVAYSCNVIAKLALDLPVLLHNHSDDSFHKDCELCKVYLQSLLKLND